MKAPVIDLKRGHGRSRLGVEPQIAERVPSREETRGRAWINGREVGGPDPRFAELHRSYD